MEFGAEVVPQYTKEQLTEAKDAAGVEVVAICAALGE